MDDIGLFHRCAKTVADRGRPPSGVVQLARREGGAIAGYVSEGPEPRHGSEDMTGTGEACPVLQRDAGESR
jgi:hypothetical protein